jgi:glyoxylase-like metal-dependent hydrolase (beta-lactamase superfamily II)
MAATAKPEIKAFFDEPTNTVSYLVWDPATKDAAVVDPVLDFDHKSGEANVKAADALLAEATRLGLKIGRVLETHVHADHLSAAPYIKQKTGAPVCIGEHIRDVQQIFRPVFNAVDVSGEGVEFDELYKDGELLKIGNLDATVMYTPGHTPACVSYRIGDAVFVGDTMFMPDYGTARADFPGGDARQLYRSIRRILALPGETRLFMCHDYKAPGRDQYAWETTVAEERAGNVHIHDGISEEEFVAKRTARDKTLSTPVLLLPSIQVNMRAGHFPPAEAKLRALPQGAAKAWRVRGRRINPQTGDGRSCRPS